MHFGLILIEIYTTKRKMKKELIFHKNMLNAVDFNHVQHIFPISSN